MEVFHSLEQLPDFHGTVVTDGMFDGMHIGHQQILTKVVEEAKRYGLTSVLLTYWPHPRHVLTPDREKLKLLTTLEEKEEMAAGLGIDYLVVLEFNKEFSEKSHEWFLSEVLVNAFKTRRLIIGYDHRFGRDRIGDFAYLTSMGKQYGFDLLEISPQEIDEIAISSTKIRYALQHKLMEAATQFLGRPYIVTGIVGQGDQRGRTIGFPTANLQIDENKLLPADGVYATFALVDGDKYMAMTNVGFRPTVDGLVHKVEAHLLEFEGDLYGKRIQLQFISPIRDEQKFPSFDHLKSQLELDRTLTRRLLASA